MKTVKEQIYELIQKESALHFPKGISTSDIANLLSMQRTNVSAILNELVKENKLTKTLTRPVLYLPNNESDEVSAEKVFDLVVGAKGSLRNAIALTKAAILYPEVHKKILLRNEFGCGTSYFAQLIYAYGQQSGVIKPNGKFIKCNARHYSKNIDQLNSVIFGNETTESLFEQAKDGLLFIDNYDQLDGTQKAVINDYIETGYIHDNHLGKEVDYRDVFLVVSVPVNASTQLVQKLPFIIELPTLANRSLEERLELIHHFFSIEASSADRNITVNKVCMQTLLLAEFPNNVKELYYVIKGACANAYVRVMDDINASIYVVKDDLKHSLQQALVNYRDNSESIDQLLGDEEYIYYDKTKGYQRIQQQNVVNIYAKLQSQYDDLIQRGISVQSTVDVINKQVKSLLSFFKINHGDSLNLSQLSKIVDNRIIDSVLKMKDEIVEQLNRPISSAAFYGICLHLNALFRGTNNPNRINNKQLAETIKNYPQEFAICSQFSGYLKEKLDLTLDNGEIALLTLFIVEGHQNNKNPVLLYIMHGSGVAKNLAEVTNALTHAHNAYSYDMELSSSTSLALEEIKSLILSIDQGAGVLVIYDMGSIATMLDTISESVKVKLRYIALPITLIGIDIARKCAMNTNIDDVFHMAVKEIFSVVQNDNQRNNIIITLCHTGEGGAQHLKTYIDLYSKLGYKTVSLSISNRDQLIKEVLILKKTGNIHAFVGTYDPKLFGIPFISIEKIFENSSDDIDRILNFEPTSGNVCDYKKVYTYLQTSLQVASIVKIKEVLPDIVDSFSLMYGLDNDVQMGLFMHLAALIDRQLLKKDLQVDPKVLKLLDSYHNDATIIRKTIRPIEKSFKIIIDDYEIATLLSIILQI